MEPTAVVQEEIDLVRASARLRIDPRLIEDWKKLQRQLYDSQKSVARIQNVYIRAMWAAEGATLDEYIAKNGGPPKKGKEWKSVEIDGYKLGRAAAPELASGIASASARIAWQKWRSVRWDALIRQSLSPPHYRDTVPIPVRGQDYSIVQRGKQYVVLLTLLSGRGNRWEVPIEPRDSHHRKVLGNVSSGAWKGGSLLIERDRRTNRWYIRIAYKRRVAKGPNSKKTAAINRGIRVFLAGVTDSGERWIYDGNDIVSYLRQVQKRRREYQYDSKASGRSGRGRKRILRPIEHLSGKAERWRKTKCQVIARRFTNWLVDRGVGTLLVENFTQIRDTDIENEHVYKLVQEWPYYQLEQRIRSCCAEAGIEVVTMPPDYISQECPKCGNVDEKARDFKRWQYRCTATACSYREHLDASACRVLLKRSTEPEPEKPKKSDKPKKKTRTRKKKK